MEELVKRVVRRVVVMQSPGPEAVTPQQQSRIQVILWTVWLHTVVHGRIAILEEGPEKILHELLAKVAEQEIPIDVLAAAVESYGAQADLSALKLSQLRFS